MSVIITPPNLTLKRKVKVHSRARGGIGAAEAVAAGDAVLAVRLDAARAELERLVCRLGELKSCVRPVEDDRHDLLSAARQVADTAGTFGFHAMTEVGRSLEGYLLALLGRRAPPDPTVVVLHTEAIGSLLGRNARGDLGPAERQLLLGLRKVAEKSLAKACAPARTDGTER